MTDTNQRQPQGNPAPDVQQERPWHLFDLLSSLRSVHPQPPEPQRITARQQDRFLEMLFDDPAHVIAWAAALNWARPVNRDNPDLRQTMVESVGSAYGWRIEFRHVYTAPSVAAPRHLAQPS